MEDVKSIDEVFKIAECLTRREIYKTKVSFVCQKCGVKTEISLRQFKERGKKKLLKYFEKNYKPKSLISYCWKDYFEGKSYTDSGFKLSKETKPNYFYTKNSLSPLESREKFQKHKLKKVLKTFDENLTEQENMKNNNYLKIFDYGNYVFKKSY